MSLLHAAQEEALELHMLSQGAALVVASVRHWALAHREQDCSRRSLLPLYEPVDAVAAIPLLDELLTLFSASPGPTIRVGIPWATTLTRDEQVLLSWLRTVERTQHDVSAMIMPFPVGPLARALRRVAALYVASLNWAGLSLIDRRAVVGEVER